MSSKTNSRRRTSAASSSSVSLSESSTLRSVERSAWLRMSASDLTPPATEYSCWTTLASFWRITSSTCLTTSGRVSPMRAIRSAISACSASGRLREHLRGKRGVQVGDHERDRLRRLVAQERDDLLGRRPAQELERPALDHGRQAADDLRGALGAERALEHVARVVDAAGGQRVVGLDRGGELLEHAVGGAGSTRWSFAISSDSDSISSSRRCWKTSAARSVPSETSSTAAFLPALDRAARRRALGRVGAADSAMRARARRTSAATSPRSSTRAPAGRRGRDRAGRGPRSVAGRR